MPEVIDIDVKAFSQKGRQILEALSPQLEKEHKGEVVAIEIESQEYFLGRTTHEALQKAKRKHPGKVFHLGRIGYRAVARRR